jgi:hypothetical protein
MAVRYGQSSGGTLSVTGTLAVHAQISRISLASLSGIVLGRQALIVIDPLFRRRRTSPIPIIPVPSSNKDPGSGIE